MKKIKIFDSTKKEDCYITIIRYFLYSNDAYVVYYDSEEMMLDGNRMHVYVSKLRDKISVTILDSEWKDVYAHLKMIGYAKKNGKVFEVIDLPYDELKGIILRDSKCLTLSYDNLKYFSKEDLLEETSSFGNLREAKRIPRISSMEEEDYRLLYQKKLEENETLRKKIEDLENLTLSYELNFEQIRKILKEKEKQQ